ncbi:MAG: UvrD-helicase domain-containing protein [candidate division KSB1 bacterium]|nr:UvrD-helicase domain-containing protein [candidate division KSB1 bacterium]
MKYISDLHIHSYYSRATSKQLNLEHLNKWAQIKGLQVIATGDITHPQWLEEMREKLEPDGTGFFKLKPEYQKQTQSEVPKACESEVRFILSGEISSIYKKGERVRKNHNVVFFPSLDAVQAFQNTLDRIGNIHSDGRPILGLDARDLLEIVLDTHDQGYLIPAHIWTPWFSLFGSKSGFDRIQDCFEDLTPHIFALETGLSSDPPMNWRLSALDGYTLVSNSDAHSPAKLAREANIVDTDLSYSGLFDAIRSGDSFLGTIEFFPEEGKYHMDGHRKCSCMMRPPETMAHDHLCPECGKPVTLGVSYRVEQLADRPPGFRPESAPPFHSLIPLPEVLSEVMQVGPQSKRVNTAYFKLLNNLGSELSILVDIPIDDIQRAGGDLTAKAVKRMRAGEVNPQPGYDGEFGVIRIFKPGEREKIMNQDALFQPSSKSVLKKKPQKQSLRTEPENKAADQKEPYGINEDQEAAIRHRGSPLIVQAGPGTGKTHTLTHRIASLIETGDTPPDAILTITFTHKAAEEIATASVPAFG